MKIKTLLIPLLVLVALACVISMPAVGQQSKSAESANSGAPGGAPGGTMGRGGMQMPGALTQEQRQKITEAIQADLTPLDQKLQNAQTEAVKAALGNASESSVKAKIEGVAKIQTEIAMLRFKKGLKAITLTDEQKRAMQSNATIGYIQLFGTGFAGFGRSTDRGAGGRGGN
jgi:Spy/CpxP family protein refolding chaperone